MYKVINTSGSELYLRTRVHVHKLLHLTKVSILEDKDTVCSKIRVEDGVILYVYVTRELHIEPVRGLKGHHMPADANVHVNRPRL